MRSGDNSVGDAARLSAATVQRELDLSDAFVARLGRMSWPADAPELVLPDDRAAADLLERMAVGAEDRASTLAARPDPARHPALWWVLERVYHDVLATMGEPPTGWWLALPASTDPLGRHLYVWACLALAPHVRAYHARCGVPDEISWASLTGLAEQLNSTCRLTARPGIDSSWTLPRTFRGTGYRLGRLSFERGRTQPDPTTHSIVRSGRSHLNTHVPADAGPLDPESVEESLRQAREFFPRYFPEHVQAFGCHSWLMDEQLASYLPATSNILAFQCRFSRFNDAELSDWEPIGHVFHRRPTGPGRDVPAAVLDQLPQRTSLERAIVIHLRNGGHWYNRTGWFPF